MDYNAILAEVKDTEAKLGKAELQYQQLGDFMDDCGDSLSEEAVRKADKEMKRLEGVMNILSASLGMLEADLKLAAKGEQL